MKKRIYNFLLMFVMTNIMTMGISTVKAEVWDGVTKTITINSDADVVTLEFTATETKTYTFQCDTKGVEVKLKANSSWGDPLYNDWAGATIDVAATQGDVINLVISAPNEPEFPVSFPLSIKGNGGGGGEVTPGDAWDGSAKKITLTSDKDSKVLSYTASQKELLYIYSEATAYDVHFAGSLDGEELPWEAYDNMVGGFSSIVLNAGDVLTFTVTSVDFMQGGSEGDDTGFPRTFTVKSIAIPMSGWSVPGSSMDAAVTLTQSVETIVPVNENVELLESPYFEQYSELSILKFTSTDNALVNIDIDEFVIWVWEEDNFGSTVNAPLAVNMDGNQGFGDNDNSHKFAVKSGKTYYVLVTNNRPKPATLSYVTFEDGTDCAYPIDITSANTSLSVKTGITWYRYAVDATGNILVLSPTSNWNGTIQYNTDCFDTEPLSIDVAQGEKAILELDADREVYLIKVIGSAAGTISLAQRAALAGEAKVNPKQASLGSNNFGGEKRNYWFTYTTTKDCMLTITHPEDALTLLVLGDGSTNVAYPGTTSTVVRANAGEEYRMRFAASNQSIASFTVAEKDIVVGDYCDYPRPLTLGTTITMKNRNAMEEWYGFSVAEPGFIEIDVDDATWIENNWTTNITVDCEGRKYAMNFTESRGVRTYKYPVTPGIDYRFTVYQFTNGGTDIVIPTRFVPASAGESCGNAIVLSLNEAKLCGDTQGSVWYEFTAPEAGDYYLIGALGQGGNLKYMLGDCNAQIQSSTSVDYQFGRSYQELTMAKGQVVKMSAVIANDKAEGQRFDYAVIVRKATTGDVLENPFIISGNTYYKLGAGNVAAAATGHFYQYTTTDAKIEISLLTEEAYFSGISALYTKNASGNLERVGFTPNKVKTDNGDGTYTYVLTLTGNNVVAGKAYVIEFPYNVLGFNMGSTLTGLDKAEMANEVKVYPNPSDGNFEITFGEFATDGTMIEVVDMTGKVLYKESVTSNATTVNLRNVATGVYFVKVSTDANSIVKKLIVR